MAKSNRRRRQDRAKRQVRDNQKQTATQRQRDWQQGEADRADHVKRLSDPATPVAELAALLNERYDGESVFGYEVDRLKNFGWPTERLVSVADALLADGVNGEPSLTALTFASEVARETGDTERARALLDQAFEAPAASDRFTRLNLTSLLRFTGRQAEAITLIEASLREDPDARTRWRHTESRLANSTNEPMGSSPRTAARATAASLGNSAAVRASRPRSAGSPTGPA